jgi:trimethylamine--corrinoid protein Co-methyltransferase
MNDHGSSRQYLELLSESELDKLHESTLKVLGNTGVSIDNSTLREVLAEEGAELERDSNIVRFPTSLVERAMETAPEGFSLYERGDNGKEVKITGSTVHTHTTGGPSYIRDLESGERRKAKIEDVKNGARITSHLDNIHAYSPMVSPTDVVSGAEQVEMVNAAVRNTEKIVENPVDSGTEVEFLYRIFRALAGGDEQLKEKPGFVISVSPISPLAFDRLSSEALIEGARKGLPTKILPAPTTGGTAPVTFAGALVQQNAELLAGLVIVQTISPGLSTVLGPRLSIMDMRTSYVSWGTNELGMASACAVQLLNRYDIPSDVYGLSSDSKIMDQQQGYEKSMNGIVPALAGADFLSGAGGLESLKSCSLAQLVIDNEVFGMIMDTVNGFEISEETIALDLIDSVGPRGDFLREKHTARHARKGEQYQSQLSNRDTWEKWITKGRKEISEVAENKARSILEDSEPVNLEPETEKELDRILEEAHEYYRK